MAQLDKIAESVYRISSTAGPGGFSFNQFLIKDEKSTLVHTGALAQFKGVMDSLSQVLDIKLLTYLFISHFESDECGSLSNFLSLNPDLIPVCSAVTARQLQGFGLHGSPHIVKPGEELLLGKHRLRFISYPSEMHLWEGLLAYDPIDKILFSSDLFVDRGGGEAVIKKTKKAESLKIDTRSIPSDEGRSKCQADIDQLDIHLVAVGHGPVLDLSP
jgi:flavorubredoxin